MAPQVAAVLNFGVASAETGDNFATGNTSANFQSLGQTIPAADVPVVGVASNTADVGHQSDGSASIRTGGAVAQGNHADTDLSQEIDPSGLVLSPQLGIVANVGVGSANTGDSFATGNASANSVGGSQTVEIGVNNTGTQLFAGTIAFEPGRPAHGERRDRRGRHR